MNPNIDNDEQEAEEIICNCDICARLPEEDRKRMKVASVENFRRGADILEVNIRNRFRFN